MQQCRLMEKAQQRSGSTATGAKGRPLTMSVEGTLQTKPKRRRHQQNKINISAKLDGGSRATSPQNVLLNQSGNLTELTGATRDNQLLSYDNPTVHLPSSEFTPVMQQYQPLQQLQLPQSLM